MTRGKKRFLILALILSIFLVPWNTKFDDDFFMDRWQLRMSALIYDFNIDRIKSGPNESTGYYLAIPDEHCYKSVGGRTGFIMFQIYTAPPRPGMHGPRRKLVIDIHGGDFWGVPTEFHCGGGEDAPRLGNWCACAIRTWVWDLSK